VVILRESRRQQCVAHPPRFSEVAAPHRIHPSIYVQFLHATMMAINLPLFVSNLLFSS
jgi:hypothetical protein